jgi:hypothetical protein
MWSASFGHACLPAAEQSDLVLTFGDQGSQPTGLRANVRFKTLADKLEITSPKRLAHRLATYDLSTATVSATSTSIPHPPCRTVGNARRLGQRCLNVTHTNQLE